MATHVIERLHGVGRLWCSGRPPHHVYYQLTVLHSSGRVGTDARELSDGSLGVGLATVQGTLTLRATAWTLPPGVRAAGERLAIQLSDERTVLVDEMTGGTTQRFVRGVFQTDAAAQPGAAA